MTTCIATRKALAVDTLGMVKSHPDTLRMYATKINRSVDGAMVWVSTGYNLPSDETEHLTKKLWLLGSVLAAEKKGIPQDTETLFSEICDAVKCPTIILTREHLILVMDGRVYVADERVTHYVIGSGGVYAKMAFGAGRSVTDCIKFCVDNEELTGGEVETVFAKNLSRYKVR